MATAPTGVELELDDIVQVVIWTKLGTQAGLNVLHYIVTSVDFVGGNDMSLLIDGLYTNTIPTSLKALMSTSAGFQGFAFRRIKPTLSVEFLENAEFGAGDVAGDPLPYTVAGLISKRSATAGKRRGGRVFVQFPGEGDNGAGSTPSAGYLSRLTTHAENLAAPAEWGFAAGRARPCIYGPPRTTPPRASRFSMVRDMVASELWATQRRRSLRSATNLSPFG
jgi:hypothetical protein